MLGMFINWRNSAGALLFLIMVGEMAVGFHNGLFTVPGASVLLILYLLYFTWLDSIVAKYRLTGIGLVLVTFGTYSVLITGLLHGELVNFLVPGQLLITAIIRVQCSLFPLFAYAILNRFWRRPAKIASPRAAGTALGAYFVLLSLGGGFGLPKLVRTFSQAGLLAVIFSILAIISVWAGLKLKGTAWEGRSGSLFWVSLFILAVGIIPSTATFMILAVVMIFAAVWNTRQLYGAVRFS